MDTIFGTWDFKWPQGTKIRVAFQELPAPDAASMPPLSDIIGLYRKIADRWLQRQANISFVFLDQTLSAPIENVAGVYNLRSPAGWLPIEYDVLVSFASTPAVIAGVDPVTPVTGQVSVLGSYARRINHGTPTTLVGPNRNFVPKGKTLHDYFYEPIFSEIVLHELGHVLGIPHQHQNPLYDGRPALKSDGEINRALDGIRETYWTQFAPEIEQEIRRPWPTLQPNGNDVPFSDWLPLYQNASQRLENRSVMVHPIWSSLTTLSGLEALNPPHQNPTDFDLDLLNRMYPPR